MHDIEAKLTEALAEAELQLTVLEISLVEATAEAELSRNGVRKFRRFWDAVDQGGFVEAYAELLDSQWAKSDSPARAMRMARRFRDDRWQLDH
ncbi:MAG: hypothetical protein AAF542_00070 [Pseudomonadota bacterium]